MGFKLKNTVILLIFGLTITYYFYDVVSLSNSLKNRGVCSTGTQVSHIRLPKTNCTEYIEYIVNDKKYKITYSKYTVCNEDGRKVSILYDSLNPSTAIVTDTCITDYRKKITFWEVYKRR